VGMRSVLAATAPDSWFFQRHGQRVLRNSRYMLDFRNPDVVDHLAAVIRRLVNGYGIGYIKMDYNVNTLSGTDLGADSPGQGLLAHNRAVLKGLESILREFSGLVIENCGSGGGRMDYAMLSRLHIQSMTDQEDYRRLPSILVGVSAAVVPEQIGVWSYPLPESDSDQASFNMVTALTARIHQSGRLDLLTQDALAQVQQAISVYKSEIRPYLPQAVPFYPLGMPDIHEKHKPVVLGMRSDRRTFVSVWRLEGREVCELPIGAQRVVVLFPSELGIKIEYSSTMIRVRFPRQYMGCMLLLS
ncbi:MAG: glycoside hydrolase family 36 protein, partial [Minisyncoccia bacterium]